MSALVNKVCENGEWDIFNISPFIVKRRDSRVLHCCLCEQVIHENRHYKRVVTIRRHTFKLTMLKLHFLCEQCSKPENTTPNAMSVPENTSIYGQDMFRYAA